MPDYKQIQDWLMARGALQQAAGAQQPAQPITQPNAQAYLAQQIASNPNNRPPNPYETQLSPQEEAQFQVWKAQNAPYDSGEDYDLRGAFKANISKDSRGHGPDTFKKPNHPTFSDQSMYSTPQMQGGQWIERDNQTFYVPSPVNLQHRSFEDLQDYFNKIEPNVKLVRQAGPAIPTPIMNKLRGGQ